MAFASGEVAQGPHLARKALGLLMSMLPKHRDLIFDAQQSGLLLASREEKGTSAVVVLANASFHWVSLFATQS